MKKLSFKLVQPVPSPFLQGPQPDQVSVPIIGHNLLVKKKDRVCTGMRIGIHPEPKRGDVHATIDGIVTDITKQAVTIRKLTPEEEADASSCCIPMSPVDLSELEGDELAAALKSLGLGMREFKKPGQHVVINGFNPEPGIHWAGSMYNKYLDQLKAGVDVVRRLVKPSQISIVIRRGSEADFGNDVRHFYIKGVYPNSVRQLIIKEATGQENPPNVSHFNLHSLWRYGQVAVTGLPALTTVMTVQDTNYVVLAGTPIRSLLAHVGITPEDGDYVILGGYMRGEAVDDLDRCVASYSYGLYHVPKNEFAQVHENPCVNCGACVQYCPAKLMPNIISRNVEFQNYEECKRLHVASCMDCGLCSYYCISRRPMLQYMREAKKALQEMASKELPMQG